MYCGSYFLRCPLMFLFVFFQPILQDLIILLADLINFFLVQFFHALLSSAPPAFFGFPQQIEHLLASSLLSNSIPLFRYLSICALHSRAGSWSASDMAESDHARALRNILLIIPLALLSLSPRISVATIYVPASLLITCIQLRLALIRQPVSSTCITALSMILSSNSLRNFSLCFTNSFFPAYDRRWLQIDLTVTDLAEHIG